MITLFDIAGRRALVTGAPSGLGRHFAKTMTGSVLVVDGGGLVSYL